MKPYVRKVRRSVNAASTIGFTVIAITLAFLNIWVHNETSNSAQTSNLATNLIPSAIIWAAWTVFVAAIVFWVFQTWSEYDRRLNDPSWILKFQDTWLSSAKQRRFAAESLLAYHVGNEGEKKKADLDLIDDVLDILEDVGFYVDGDQISPEVAHHHLFYWIRGYWFAAQPYIAEKQRLEATQWDHLGPLYKETSEIEAKKRKEKPVSVGLSGNQIVEFLTEEIEAETDETDDKSS